MNIPKRKTDQSQYPKRPPAKGDSAEKTRVSRNISVEDRAEVRKSPRNAEKKPVSAVPQTKFAGKKKSDIALGKILRSTAIKAVIYIAVVVGVSALLSFFGIRWANDVFAFVKDENEVEISIPDNASVSELADILYDGGVIEYPFVFRMYVEFKYRNDDPPLSFKTGTFTVKSTLNYDQLVSELKYRVIREVVKITIPEGYTVDQIIELFVSRGMGSREKFVDVINNYPFDYSFLDELYKKEFSKDRRYRLEGYLFPDTYQFYADSSEVAIVDKMLENFEDRFDPENYARVYELDMDLDQIITLASIIQQESKFPDEFYTISGVFHNRINSPYYTKLQSCATVQYCLKERKEVLSDDDLMVDNPYNTYLIDGLPPGPISNPGLDAILAALYPEYHNYYYFVVNINGRSLFATNSAEHEANKKLVEKNRADAQKNAKQNVPTV